MVALFRRLIYEDVSALCEYRVPGNSNKSFRNRIRGHDLRCRASSGGPYGLLLGSFRDYLHTIRRLDGCSYLSLKRLSCTVRPVFRAYIPDVGSASNGHGGGLY